MFLVLLTYTADLDTIDGLMKRHVAFLEPHLKSGTFVAAGRQNPRTGGVILVRAKSREAVAEIMAVDPFMTEGAAEFEVIEFRTSLHHADFKPFADPRTRTVR